MGRDAARRVAAEVQVLLQERQAGPGAGGAGPQLDASLRQFALGASCSTWSTRPSHRARCYYGWAGPRTHCAKNVQARAARHTRHVGMSRVFPEFNVERLRPYLRRPNRLSGDSGARRDARHHQRWLPRTARHRRRLPAAPARHSWWQG